MGGDFFGDLIKRFATINAPALQQPQSPSAITPSDFLDIRGQQRRVAEITAEDPLLGGTLAALRTPIDLPFNIISALTGGQFAEPSGFRSQAQIQAEEKAGATENFLSQIDKIATSIPNQVQAQVQAQDALQVPQAQIPQFTPTRSADFGAAQQALADAQAQFGSGQAPSVAAPTLTTDPGIDPQVFKDLFALQQQGLEVPERDRSADQLDKLSALFAGAQQGLQGQQGFGAALGGFGTGAARGVTAASRQIRSEELQNQKDMRQSQLALAQAQFNMNKSIADTQSFQIQQQNKQTALNKEFELKNVSRQERLADKQFRLAETGINLEKDQAVQDSLTAARNAQGQLRADEFIATHELRNKEIELRKAQLGLRANPANAQILSTIKSLSNSNPVKSSILSNQLFNNAVAAGDKNLATQALAHKIAFDPTSTDILFPNTAAGNAKRKQFDDLVADAPDRVADIKFQFVLSELQQFRWNHPDSIVTQMGLLGDPLYTQALIFNTQHQNALDARERQRKARPNDLLNPSVSTARRK